MGENKIKTLVNNRYALGFAFIAIYLCISFVTRSIFYILSVHDIDFSLVNLLKIYAFGLFFDLGTAFFFIFPYVLYVLFVPQKLVGSLPDKVLTYFILALTIFLSLFGFLGEFPFWEEFNTRYNFIAVDYLIYTYEVVENINQSYPLPLLVSGLVLLSAALFFLFYKLGAIKAAFSGRTAFKSRLVYFSLFLGIPLFFTGFITNKQAEFSDNTYVNELSKNGVYSLFAAYRSNELDYDRFYKTLPVEESFQTIKNELVQDNQTFDEPANEYSLERNTLSSGQEQEPNIILVCVESLSADFLGIFGNEKQLTPNIDQISQQSILFTDMYATGTRTVRGMEALVLSVPPTPGHSIVRRLNNQHLSSIASIFRQKDYELNFFYGGDGYFDNMNSFFGGQGFNIYDRNRGNLLSEKIETTRNNITDDEVSFENAWGVCDGDMYNKLMKVADENYEKGKRTFSFLMTTSNHRPYSFPEGKIDLPNGTREAAVTYTDYALGEFIKQAQSKPWFDNTVFVLVADHCASSAGKWEITVDKHHIPALIYNLPHVAPQKVDKLCSQIDVMPTLFGYLNWDYSTSLYGKDISEMAPEEERSLIGNYRTVGLLKGAVFTELTDKKNANQYSWLADKKEMSKLKNQDTKLVDLTIAYYESAAYRYKEGLMKEEIQ
ncbi:sulfatase-like hydrolase/transferase [Maribellus sp. CM-23]|uniref:LTA synthase family protein n=1 Tax=Maribellus sp. CM-23 TaxID=2781026 RepID=UPI001F3B1F11|nr:alkaline phosphatase family protein [Maribellus sp. CM-23]MCE4565164.1 sulfatase-like hydrolase/transferase [Maribellus sp. CM-23]